MCFPLGGESKPLGQKAMRPWHKKLLVLTAAGGVVVVGMIVATSGGSDDAAPAGATTGAAEADSRGNDTDGAATEAEPTALDAAGIGDAVRDGQFEFVVEGVEKGLTNVGGEFGENAQGEFTLVTMTVTNTGDEPQLFVDSEQSGTDSQGPGGLAGHDRGHLRNEGTEGFLAEINPGNSITVKVVYDLPAGETPTGLMLHDSIFSGGAAVELA